MLLPLRQNARSALLIIDMQEYFFQKEDRRKTLDQVVANINRLIDHFNGRLLPVYHIVSRYKADGSDWDLKMKAAGKPELIIGTQEAAILPEINVSGTHAIVTKTRYSAFFKTHLAELLQDQKIDRVVVTGAYTHYCVNATIFDAYCHDYIPCLITDAVVSHLEAEAQMMIERMRRNGYHQLTARDFMTG